MKETKICPKCKAEKEKKEFSKSKFKIISGRCKLCIKEDSKKYYIENKNTINNKNKEWAIKNEETNKEYQKNYRNKHKKHINTKNDIIGKRFGKLVVLSSLPREKNKREKFKCVCDCGVEKIIFKSNLERKHGTKSCGCIIQDINNKLNAEFIGKRFGRLTVENLIYNKKRATYLCKCDCGNTKEVKKVNLISNNTRSCGCLYIQTINNKTNDLTGKTFSNLIVLTRNKSINKDIKHNSATWNCKCVCGKIKLISSTRLLAGKSKSCGCRTNFRKLKRPAIETSARAVYFGYNDGDLTFEQFLEFSQKNCYYCEIEPQNKYNTYVSNTGPNSKILKETGVFTYNGLDRVDSQKLHDFNNVVPCCKQCNTAKQNYTLCNFKEFIKRLYTNFSKIYLINNNFNKKYFIEKFEKFYCDQINSKNNIIYSSNKFKSNVIVKYNGIYNDGNLSLDQFYKLTQMNCYYCNKQPSNVYNGYKNNKKIIATGMVKEYDFIYNGLDRVDSNLKHTINNVVPCCKQCNFAKYTYNIEEFAVWITRIYENFGAK